MNVPNILFVLVFLSFLFTVLSCINVTDKESFFSFILSPNTRKDTLHSGSPFPVQDNPRRECVAHILKNNCST